MAVDPVYTRKEVESSYRWAVRELDKIFEDFESGKVPTEDLIPRMNEVREVAARFHHIADTPRTYHPELVDVSLDYAGRLLDDLGLMQENIAHRRNVSKFVQDLVLRLGIPEHLARQVETAVEKAPVEDAMKWANKILGGYGVENIRDERNFVSHYWQDTVLLYVNMGDTYDPTLCYDTDDKEYFIGSWGDFVEEKGIR